MEKYSSPFDNQRIFQSLAFKNFVCPFSASLETFTTTQLELGSLFDKVKRTCGLYTKPKVLGDTFLQEKQEKVSKNSKAFYFLLAIIKLFLGVQLGGSSLQSLTWEYRLDSKAC